MLPLRITSRIFFQIFLSKSYAITRPTVAPPTAPKGPPTRKPVTPGIRRLSNHEPEATSMAKSSESLLSLLM